MSEWNFPKPPLIGIGPEVFAKEGSQIDWDSVNLFRRVLQVAGYMQYIFVAKDTDSNRKLVATLLSLNVGFVHSYFVPENFADTEHNRKNLLTFLQTCDFVYAPSITDKVPAAKDRFPYPKETFLASLDHFARYATGYTKEAFLNYARTH